MPTARKAAKGPMPTSAAKTCNPPPGQQGFTLIEILVALVLVSLIFTLVPSSEDSRRHRDLQQAIDDFDRAIRFASDEAVLRNSITRLRVDLDKNPVEFVVEYGPKGDLVIPQADPEKTSPSLDEIKKQKEQQSKLDSQFNKVEEFASISRELSVEVQFLGIAASWSKILQKTGQTSTYFYPTGERDAALLFFGTQDEMGVLEIRPFQDKTVATYFVFPRKQNGDLDVAKAQDFQETKMQDIFKEWQGK